MSVNVLTPRSTEGGQRSSDRAHICLTCFGSCLGVTLCRVKFAKKIDESVPAVLECREMFGFATRFKVLNVNGSFRTPIHCVFRDTSGQFIQRAGIFHCWTQFATTHGMSLVVRGCQPFKDEHQQFLLFHPGSLCVARSLCFPTDGPQSWHSPQCKMWGQCPSARNSHLLNAKCQDSWCTPKTSRSLCGRRLVVRSVVVVNESW